MEVIPQKNVGSQVERAIIALLFDVWPKSVQFPNFYFSNDWKARKANPNGLIDVLCISATENPPFSACKDCNVNIMAEWPGINQPGAVNSEFNRVQINNLIGVSEAALRLTNNGTDYMASAWKMTAVGRRLAVLGMSHIFGSQASAMDNVANNADMATFICDFVEGKTDVRAKGDKQGTWLTEERTWMIRAYNGNDNSIFPALTFDGAHTLNWTFASGALPEPAHWMVFFSFDGSNWNLNQVLASGVRSADITGTGTQYWRVVRSDDGVNENDPESNLVKATA